MSVNTLKKGCFRDFSFLFLLDSFLRKIYRKCECLPGRIGNASVEDRVQIDGEKTAFARFVKIAFFPRRVHRSSGNRERRVCEALGKFRQSECDGFSVVYDMPSVERAACVRGTVSKHETRVSVGDERVRRKRGGIVVLLLIRIAPRRVSACRSAFDEKRRIFVDERCEFLQTFRCERDIDRGCLRAVCVGVRFGDEKIAFCRRRRKRKERDFRLYGKV